MPAAFGPLGIPGVAAKSELPANTVIIKLHFLRLSLQFHIS
jgi:hypothetical protein